jgi:tetratricopeptide (TPR) repeat protein
MYGLHLARLGRGQQGLSELERALSLDPLSLIIATDVAETYYLLRKPDEAMTRINHVQALNPDFALAHMVKGKILEELHRYHEAEDELAESGRLFGRFLAFLSISNYGRQALDVTRSACCPIVPSMLDYPLLAQLRIQIIGRASGHLICRLSVSRK